MPYYWQIGPNRDLTHHAASLHRCLPGDRSQVQRAQRIGAFQVGGFLTYGTIDDVDPTSTPDSAGLPRLFRGQRQAAARPAWSITSSFRVASDKTVTRRYDITNDDRLRNVVNAERITPNSYISIAGWAFQGLRVDDIRSEFRSRFRRSTPASARTTSLGGKVELQANSLAILRIDGQDTQRAFASARWDLRRLTPWGQDSL